MAYTNAPTNTTYKTDTLTFDGTDGYRTGNLATQRDCNTVNMYYERISQENERREVCLRKRPGLVSAVYNLNKNSSTDALRGDFYDVDQNAWYWAVNNKVWKLKPDSSSTPVLVTTLATSSGQVGFCSFLKSDNTRFVLFSDGTQLWVENYVAATCVAVTDPDIPTPHVPFPIYLDGYVFLIKAASGDAYNSDVDDPTAWTAGNFISAEISSDYALRMVKAKNYLIILGYNSIEYFYDAGNTTGSPLSRNDSPFTGVGYVTGLKTVGDVTYFVGQDNQKNLAVYSINSFKVERISNPVIDRIVQTITTTPNVKAQTTLNQDGFALSVDGHNFYVLTTPQTTLVYDIEDKFWYEFKGSDGTGIKFQAIWGMFNGACYAAIAGQTTLSMMGHNVYQDFGVNFTAKHQTKDYTADTYRWKNMNRLMLIADQYQATGISNITVSWSNNDWFSNTADGSRTLNLFTESPYFNRLGRFRNRSFKLEYTDNFPLRIRSLEFELNVMGT